jgi:hypothetical protein
VRTRPLPLSLQPPQLENVVSHHSSPPHSLTHSRTLLHTRTQNTHMHSAVAVLCDSCGDVIASLQCGLSPECSHSHTRRPVDLVARRQNVFVTTLSLSHTHPSPDATDHTSHTFDTSLLSRVCVRLAPTRSNIHHVCRIRSMHLEPIAAHRISFQSAFFIPSIHSVVCLLACTYASVPALLHRPFAEEDDEDDDLPVSLALWSSQTVSTCLSSCLSPCFIVCLSLTDRLLHVEGTHSLPRTTVSCIPLSHSYPLPLSRPTNPTAVLRVSPAPQEKVGGWG